MERGSRRPWSGLRGSAPRRRPVPAGQAPVPPQPGAWSLAGPGRGRSGPGRTGVLPPQGVLKLGTRSLGRPWTPGLGGSSAGPARCPVWMPRCVALRGRCGCRPGPVPGVQAPTPTWNELSSSVWDTEAPGPPSALTSVLGARCLTPGRGTGHWGLWSPCPRVSSHPPMPPGSKEVHLGRLTRGLPPGPAPPSPCSPASPKGPGRPLSVVLTPLS